MASDFNVGDGYATVTLGEWRDENLSLLERGERREEQGPEHSPPPCNSPFNIRKTGAYITTGQLLL